VLNPFIIRKWAALVVPGVMATMGWYIPGLYWGLWGGVAGFLLCLLLGALLGTFLLNNPFTRLLEGKGILALDISSTGVVRPFLVGVSSPYVGGKLAGRMVKDVFDRDAVYNLANPKEVKAGADPTPEGGIQITLSEEEYNRGRFAMFHWPLLLYNSQVDSIITKDFLSEQEKSAFAEHQILYLNRKVEELSSLTRDFARHVVEQALKPTDLLKNPIVITIMVIALIVLAVIFGPTIIQTVMATIKPATTAISTAAASGATITPMGG
jgi:hypothetical protein